ncbi:MAG TPA: Spy/CpxP family protein refolding chaperone [Acidobacteriaceae bacterium]|nr:Spy/CpxP family protein refolding chaperone [Acidobacteriaceae bacterium]
MTQNLTSRRNVAGRFALLAAAQPAASQLAASQPAAAPLAVAVLCLLSGLFSAPALAQHGGGHPMATGAPGAMMGERGMHSAPPAGANRPGGFGRPAADFHGQPRMGLQLGLGGRWWDDHGTAKKLNLNPDQQHHMDAIFETNKPTLINLYTNLQREQMGLANLSPSDLQDETKVFAAIDRVSQARSDLEKENAHILLQIRQQLDPNQLDTLDRQIAKSH